MDRFWLLTTTFYGNWLPGDPRGFVSRVRDRRPGDPMAPTRREHDIPGTPVDEHKAGLFHSAQETMRAAPIRIDREQAEALRAQFLETAAIRGWQLIASAIMANHLHLIVGVPGDPDPTKILGDFKSYGSRRLNARWGRPPSGTWWTYSGSKRKLSDQANVLAAIAYLRAQEYPLVLWVDPSFDF
jgi:REP element-mobilizing transposase RayT